MGTYSQAGAAIGAGAVSLIGGLISANKARKGYNESMETIDQRLAEIRAHRDNKYYQDPTKTAENMAAVTQAQDILNAQNEADRNRQIISGGTDESRALGKQAAAATVGNMMQQQAVEGAKNKEEIYHAGDSTIDAFTRYKADSQKAKGLAEAQNITNMANSSARTQIELAKLIPY